MYIIICCFVLISDSLVLCILESPPPIADSHKDLMVMFEPAVWEEEDGPHLSALAWASVRSQEEEKGKKQGVKGKKKTEKNIKWTLLYSFDSRQ